MAPPKRKSKSNTPDTKRPKFKVDLSGHGGNNEDVDDHTPTLHDEDIESEEDDFAIEEASEDEEEEETVEAKKLRMAREYLSKVQEEKSDDDSDEEEGSDDEEMDKIGKRIARDRLRKSGLLQTHLAHSILSGVEFMRGNVVNTIGKDASTVSPENYAKAWMDATYITYHRGHDLTPTCVTLSHEGTMAFSGSKDGSIIKWDVDAGKKMSYVLPIVKNGDVYSEGSTLSHRNEREILAVANSYDDRYLAVGGRDNCVRIFDVRTLGKSGTKPISKMEGHKRAVTSLTFRNRTLDLYSGSEDRCIRRYDLNAMTYVETLYGHQSPVISIDCANKNRPVSVARDRTVRVWKVEEDSHLVFRPGGDVGSAECVSAIQDGWFVTGHDDGRLALWREEKKRPVGKVVVAAHGHETGSGGVPRGVSCCNALSMSDVLATGSNDGYLRLWKVRLTAL
jgi:ribosomal RNA-processing protein 9